MQKAQNLYMKTQVNPGLAQLESNLAASGQGSSSYGGAYLGQQKAMGDLLSFQAALQQQQQDFNNVLAARQSLYNGPIGLQQQQNAADIMRSFGIAELNQKDQLGQNEYQLSDNQDFNHYNLGVNQIHNNYNSNIFGSQASMYNAQQAAGASRSNGLLGFAGNVINGAFNYLR